MFKLTFMDVTSSPRVERTVLTATADQAQDIYRLLSNGGQVTDGVISPVLERETQTERKQREWGNTVMAQVRRERAQRTQAERSIQAAIDLSTVKGA